MWTPKFNACNFATATLHSTFLSTSESKRSGVSFNVTRREFVPAQTHLP